MKDWRGNDSGVLFVGFVGVVGERCWERSWIGVRGERRAKLKNVRSKAESKANWRWPRRAESIRNGVVENENHKRTTFGEGA